MLLWQIVLTRQAVEDTSEATAAMREANQIAFDAQRPWIAISCKIDRIVKGPKSIHFKATLSYLNTGSLAARSFIHRGSPQLIQGEDIQIVRGREWQRWREEREASHRVLLPGEVYSDDVSMWAVTNLRPAKRTGEAPPYMLIVVAAVHYKVGGDEWHATERSFLIGIRNEGESISLNDRTESFSTSVPDMDYPPDRITVRQITSGETT